MGHPELGPLPDRLVETRKSLHQIAFFALAPARFNAVGRMGLRAAPGGFGTPEFEGRLIRVEGDTIVSEQAEQVASQVITTVRAATRFVGIDYEVEWFEDFHDPLGPVDPDAPLVVDDTAARALGQWFNLGFEVLNSLRLRGSDDDDVTEVQLWPEHFDAATELGSEQLGQRASYGASPGDETHDQPYFYVAPWGEIDRSNRYWNGESFNGASLGYSTPSAASDPVDAALDFLLEGYRILHSA
jgi:hypothetical protein